MTREQASRLVGKLRAVTVERGATPAEARVAAEKAAGLVTKFRLQAQPPRQERRERPRPSKARRRRVFVPDPPADWQFNVQTGEHSPNVKVHRYENRANWKIEVDL